MTDSRSDAAGPPAVEPFARAALGANLKRARLAAGKTMADVIATGIASQSTMTRIEAGTTRVSAAVLIALCDLYGVTGDYRAALEKQAEMSRQKGWWEEYDGSAVPNWLGIYAEAEAAAGLIETYDPELVHGLLQHPDYVRAIVAAGETDPQAIEKRVSFRLSRQQALLERASPARITSVVGEGALYQRIGSNEVMAAQVSYLRELSKREELDVRVLPFTAGAHPASKGAFTILSYDSPSGRPMVYLENHVGARYLDKDQQVDVYRGLMAGLHTRSIPMREYAA